MSIEIKRGTREEKRRKTCFIIWKSLFLFLLFYNYSFASGVQRWIGELKLGSHNFFNHSKWRTDEGDINNMFGHKWCSVIGQATLMLDTFLKIIQALFWYWISKKNKHMILVKVLDV
jgi:hypothetical protein